MKKMKQKGSEFKRTSTDELGQDNGPGQRSAKTRRQHVGGREPKELV
jgi:hypothetical protein